MAEQQADAYKKKQEELRNQYEKEQDLHDNKAMLSKDSKDKLSINFMYEPPPGVRKERDKDDNEPEYKFEWQRKYNAPRESYCKGDTEIRLLYYEYSVLSGVLCEWQWMQFFS